MDRGHERRHDDPPVPVALAELARYARPRLLRWETPPSTAVARQPTADELELLTALRSLGVLSTPQIHRRFLPRLSARSVRHRLQALAEQGWIRRGHLICAGPGQTPRLCMLGQAGRDIVSPRRDAREFHANDVLDVVRALRVAAWWFALEAMLGDLVLSVGHPAASWPDLELHVAPNVRLHVAFVGRTTSADALLARLAWWDDADAALLLVAPDEATAIALALAAGRSASATWAQRVYFTAEPEVHAQRLRALRLRPSAGEAAEVVLLDLRRRLSQTDER